MPIPLVELTQRNWEIHWEESSGGEPHKVKTAEFPLWNRDVELYAADVFCGLFAEQWQEGDVSLTIVWKDNDDVKKRTILKHKFHRHGATESLSVGTSPINNPAPDWNDFARYDLTMGGEPLLVPAKAFLRVSYSMANPPRGIHFGGTFYGRRPGKETSPPSGGQPWTFEERLRVRGPKGGWLKHGVAEGDGIRYWPAPLYFGLPHHMQLAMEEEIRYAVAGGMTHLPLIGAVLADVGLPFADVKRFNVTENPGKFMADLDRLIALGVKPLIFGGSDDWCFQNDINVVIKQLNSIVSMAGINRVAAVCPGIEMNEWSTLDDWEYLSENYDFSGVVPLFSHFTEELYFNVSGYDGILWQDKDVGHSGDLRSPFVRYAYLMNDDLTKDNGEPFMDDRYYGSPARSAKKDGITFVYFEYGVPLQVNEDLATEYGFNAIKALGELNMPLLRG